MAAPSNSIKDFQWGNNNVTGNTIKGGLIKYCYSNRGSIKDNVVIDAAAFASFISAYNNTGSILNNFLTNDSKIQVDQNETDVRNNHLTSQSMIFAPNKRFNGIQNNTLSKAEITTQYDGHPGIIEANHITNQTIGIRSIYDFFNNNILGDFSGLEVYQYSNQKWDINGCTAKDIISLLSGAIRKENSAYAITNTGSGYTPGVYYDVPVSGGTGAGAKFDVSITAYGTVQVNIGSYTNQGSGYSVSDVLTLDPFGGGSGLQVTVNNVDYLNGTNLTLPNYAKAYGIFELRNAGGVNIDNIQGLGEFKEGTKFITDTLTPVTFTPTPVASASNGDILFDNPIAKSIKGRGGYGDDFIVLKKEVDYAALINSKIYA